ncbi:vasotab [Musca domestica]|uniref:Vasotab-like n=1 Tax=Musca domestica TaxID=7370 RepID=A0A1I8N3S8_MUSDO|nr:vasotab [Musca domestica]
MVTLKWIFAIALIVIASNADARSPPRPSPGQVDESAADCPQICPALYRPVCATLPNGSKMSFSNSCQLNVAVCSKQIPAVRSQQEGDC